MPLALLELPIMGASLATWGTRALMGIGAIEAGKTVTKRFDKRLDHLHVFGSVSAKRYNQAGRNRPRRRRRG